MWEGNRETTFCPLFPPSSFYPPLSLFARTIGAWVKQCERERLEVWGGGLRFWEGETGERAMGGQRVMAAFCIEKQWDGGGCIRVWCKKGEEGMLVLGITQLQGPEAEGYVFVGLQHFSAWLSLKVIVLSQAGKISGFKQIHKLVHRLKASARPLAWRLDWH